MLSTIMFVLGCLALIGACVVTVKQMDQRDKAQVQAAKYQGLYFEYQGLYFDTVDVLDDEQHYGSELMFRLRSAEDGVSRLAETVVHQSSTIYNMTESHELLVKENERLLKEIEQLQVDHARYVLSATDLVEDIDAPIPFTLVKTIESEVADQLDQDGVGQLLEDDTNVTSIGGPIYSD